MNHLQAIESGQVTKSNVIGIRKALNADARRVAGYSVSRVAPALRGTALTAVVEAVEAVEPFVRGELHDSGLKLLQSRRYRKRLESVREIIDSLDSFHLCGFVTNPRDDLQFVPVYRARAADGRSFRFYHVAWQSGGNGPEIIS